MELKSILLIALGAVSTTAMGQLTDDIEWKKKYEEAASKPWVQSPANWEIEVRVTGPAIVITSRNISTTEQTLLKTDPFLDYLFTITEKRPWPRSPVVLHYHSFDEQSSHRRLLQIFARGEGREETVSLADFKMLKPETPYTLTVTRMLDENSPAPTQGRPSVTSSPVALVIPARFLPSVEVPARTSALSGVVTAVLLGLAGMVWWRFAQHTARAKSRA
jgi:hypothetical protein